MQLEETIAKELADIINQRIQGIDARLQSLEALKRILDVRLSEIDACHKEMGTAPAEVTDDIAKAVALLAEAVFLEKPKDNPPVVVNFSPANTGKKSKTITTRRDEAGNLVAKVVED